MVTANIALEQKRLIREAATTRGLPGKSLDIPDFVRGKGPWLIDARGERYFDCTSGSGATSLGHQHPAVVEAVVEQVRTLNHTGCKFGSEQRNQLVQALGELSPFADCGVIPAVTGAESVEVALKVARAATGAETVISFDHSFHGKTTGALCVTWRKDYARFSPLPQDAFSSAPYPISGSPSEEDRCLRELEALIERAPPLAGAIFEPVQTTEGVYIGSQRFLRDAAGLVREAGGLVIFDEIYTGMGRSGALFYCDLVEVRPDLLIVGKSLGNGFPIGAVLGPLSVIDAIPPGIQTSTFSGNPVGCAAGVAVIDVVRRENIAAGAQKIGLRIADCLRPYQDRGIGAVRQVGGLIGFDLKDSSGTLSPEKARSFAAQAARQRLLVFCGGATGATIKLVPPLVLEEDHMQFLIGTLQEVLENVSH